MIKKRKGDTNVGLFITFAIIIIIGVGTFGIYSYEYSSARKKNYILSILSNPQSSLNQIQSIGICATSTWANITYNPVSDTYKLTCSDKIGVDLWTIHGLINIIFHSGCGINDNFCNYEIRK